MSANPLSPDLDFRQLFDLAPVGLCLSRQRVVQRCNQAFAAMFGYTVAELDGQPLRRLYPSDEEYQRIGDRGLRVMRDTGRYEDERIMRKRDGSLCWFRVRGRCLDSSEPFALALWSFEDLSQRPVGPPLTPREREVAKLVVAGRTSKEAARELGVSPRTVEAHRAALMRKLGAATAAELVRRLLGPQLGQEV